MKTKPASKPPVAETEHFWVQSTNFGRLRVFRCVNCGAWVGLLGADEL